MNPPGYTFIALDLEATGLDTTHDTIIEVAAIRFRLERDGTCWQIRDQEERSMLISPGVPLTDEIILITGITEQMLEGREVWEDVRERVRVFIGDAIIVGHNVLFDTAMLQSHGIDLSGHIVLDTFELSEIFSQDAESLNLLFLAKKYDLDIQGEHRALDDTRLSLGLFLYYLERFSSMSELQYQIFSVCIERDPSSMLVTLFGILGKEPQGGYIFPYHTENIVSQEIHTIPTKHDITPVCHTLRGEIDDETTLIRKILSEHGRLIIYTHSVRQSHFWRSYLESIDIPTALLLPYERFCSLSTLEDFISQPVLSRKEMIFCIKMLFWLHATTTGLLDELKYYGEEREYVRCLRSGSGEQSYFRQKMSDASRDAMVYIGESQLSNIDTVRKLPTPYAMIFRDVYRMEDTYRKEMTRVISFTGIDHSLDSLEDGILIPYGFFASIRLALSYIEHVFCSIPQRPTGDLPDAPGDHGETYYFDQETLWNKGGIWLLIAIRSMSNHLEDGRTTVELLRGLEKRTLESCIQSLRILRETLEYRDENLSYILSIRDGTTTVSLIPRDVSHTIHTALSQSSSVATHLISYGRGGPLFESFLQSECGIDWNTLPTGVPHEPILQRGTDLRELVRAGNTIAILSTSNKHVRALTHEVQRYFQDGKIFTQGISGGKGKILSLFERQSGRRILIGTIDNWIDESSLWKQCDTVILAKMPFDPPTDPYFLARTVGMRNNFEEYSCPIALSKINMLIGRVRLARGDARIYCIDDRLYSTAWGQKLATEIL